MFRLSIITISKRDPRINHVKQNFQLVRRTLVALENYVDAIFSMLFTWACVEKDPEKPILDVERMTNRPPENLPSGC